MGTIKPNFVIWFLFTGMCLPFILVTDFYPFFRFGMFAEPVRNATQVEEFVIEANTQGRYQALSPELTGLHSSNLFYLYRAYYYQGKADLLLKEMGAVVRRKTGHSVPLRLLRLRRKPGYFAADTAIMAVTGPKPPKSLHSALKADSLSPAAKP